MTITLQAVNELITSLESAGELSIREQKFLKLAKAYQQLAAENVALKEEISNITFMRDDDFFGSTQRAQEVMGRLVNVKTPATDAYLAGIKADGVEEFLKGSQFPYQIATVLADRDGVDDATLSTVIWSGQPPEPDGDVWHIEYVSRGYSIVLEMLKQLREGSDK
ncbi:TPA: hypothetical protein ACSC6H_005124 [Klebsiella variicola]